jgi:membrane-anchored protein YejM (alkaline phosphatase superfamily)
LNLDFVHQQYEQVRLQLEQLSFQFLVHPAQQSVIRDEQQLQVDPHPR